MGDSPILEVVIGLVVVYLTLSLVCSSAIEALASGFGWRASTLRLGIARMLGEEPRTPNLLQQTLQWWVGLAQSIWWSLWPPGAEQLAHKRAMRQQSRADEIYTHPLVVALKPSELRDPSYIPNETFADVLIDRLTPPAAGSSAVTRLAALAQVLRPQSESGSAAPALSAAPMGSGGPASTGPAAGAPTARQGMAAALSAQPRPLAEDPPPAIRKFFERAQTQAGGGADATDVLAAFRKEIAQRYQDTMDRAGGWYRRHTQVWLFIVATVVVILTNADTIDIIRQLAQNPAMRATIVAQGEQLAKSSELRSDPPAQESEEARKAREALAKEQVEKLAHSGLQLGWPDPPPASKEEQPSLLQKILHPRKLSGLLITIFAVALGAPFWFQVLEKLVKLRSSGARIEGTKTPLVSILPADASAAAPAAGVIVGTVAVAPATSAGATTATLPAADLDLAYWSARSEQARRVPPGNLLAGTPQQLAAESARLSAIAYDPAYLIEKRLGELGYQGARFLERGETQVFVASVQDLGIVVSFRGTEPSRVQDLMTDAQAKRVPCRLGNPKSPTGFGEVHGGFQQALAGVLADLDTEVGKRLAANAGQPLMITGHSLGAALATLYFAHRLALGTPGELRLVTFGSPRVGDPVFVQELEAARARHGNALTLRVVNDRDLVTRVAPRALGFGHLAPVCFLDALGRITWDQQGTEAWSRFLASIVDASSDFKKAAKGALEDHSIARYVRKLDAHEGRVT